MRTLYSLILSLAVASVALAEPQVTDRVIDLPELAAGRWYLTTIISSAQTREDRNLTYFMASDPAMKRLQPQVVYNAWTDDKPIVSRTDWAKFLGASRPAILLQAPPDETGKSQVVFFASGNNLRTEVLAQRMQDAVNTYQAKYGPRKPCPDGRCPYPVLPRVPLPRPSPYTPLPQPQPQPTPITPPVTPPPAVAPIAPTIVAPEVLEEEKDGGIPLLALLIPLAAAGLGVWKSFDHS